jgi:dTDP-4-amino-4,6-dideoxygalactose transaminase
MYVPAWPVLRPSHLLGEAQAESGLPFPLNAGGTYFYVARNAIYHLAKALGGGPVLVPAYHHGNEVRAIRASGAAVAFYSIDHRLMPDLDELERLAKKGARAILTIHYMGFPQPIRELRQLAWDRGLLLIEDCALSLLSEADGLPLGAFGDYAVFCLYKTVAVPNGGLLVRNTGATPQVDASLRPADRLSVAARTCELLFQWLRSRHELPGRALMALKRAAGSTLNAARVRRIPVGDTGFDTARADTAMSSFCRSLMKRFDYPTIRSRRRSNFRHLKERLDGYLTLLDKDLADGVCPLFFPLLAKDKRAAEAALLARGIETVQFWNEGDPEAFDARFADVRFLREHVLEVPIHQDVTPEQIDYVADQILAARLGL